MTSIKKVAVLGAGTMGAGIAGVCASAGCDVLLLDLKKADCEKALERLAAGKSPAVDNPDALNRIAIGSFTDDMHKISECDWICEVVIEDLEIKRSVFLQVEAARSDGSIVSTNTSGIPLRDIYTNMPQRLQEDIAVTHFFNPVHIMKLVELVPGDYTNPEIISTLADFIGNTLEKGVVYAKDTVNFIGNRIGCFWVLSGLHFAEDAIAEEGLTIESVDAYLSEPVGIPYTGLYGLVDLIGLDVMLNVGKNLDENLSETDSCRPFINFTDNIQRLYDRNQLGRKTGGGFYQLERHDDGSKSMNVFDLNNDVWRKAHDVRLNENEKTISALFSLETPSARLVQKIMATTIHYAMDLVPEIANDIVNVDRAMRWGFGWQHGPFELADLIGADRLNQWYEENGLHTPNMLNILQQNDKTTFYRNENREFLSVSGEWESIRNES